MDSGCDFEGYVSDITRSWPISGHFTTHQRILYEAINLLQTQLIEYARNVRPFRLDRLYFFMLERMGAILMEIGFFKEKNLDRQQLLQVYFLFLHRKLDFYFFRNVISFVLIM